MPLSWRHPPEHSSWPVGLCSPVHTGQAEQRVPAHQEGPQAPQDTTLRWGSAGVGSWGGGGACFEVQGDGEGGGGGD